LRLDVQRLAGHAADPAVAAARRALEGLTGKRPDAKATKGPHAD
jgi:hypothetical protein